MKRFPKALAAACAALALSSSLALAAEPVQAPPQAPPGAPAPGQGMCCMAVPKAGPLARLSPEKQEAARKLMEAHAQAMAPLNRDLYARMAALEALNAAGEGEGSKAKAVIRDIADVNARMLAENGKFRARMIKETGLRTPVMGHGAIPGMGGHGMGGMGCGMMAGHGMAGHGAPLPPPAATPAEAATGAAAPDHSAHH